MLLLAALHTVPTVAAEPASVAATADSSSVSERLLAVRVNGIEFEAALMLETVAGKLLVDGDTLTTWGLFIPDDLAAIRHFDRDYYALDDLPELEYSIDKSTQVLIVEAGSAAFTRQVIDARPNAFRVPQTGTPGGFFNYDVLFESVEGSDVATGAFELGVFNRWGVGTTTILARGLDTEEDVVRLNTTWRYDWPAELRTLRLGDSFSRPGSWGRTVQFGGIQWGTNFGTQPDFITFPLPVFTGETAVPATVELYANELRRVQEQVQPGPFSVQDVPVVVGANELQMVVTDVLGRQQVISQPFYVDQNLLKDGLHDYTYEAGFIRENFSLESNDYSRPFIVGTHRLGLTDWFTGEVRAEVLREYQTAGVSAATLAPPWLGTVFGSLAGSTGDAGEGALASIGFDRQGRRFNYGLQTTWTTEDFRQLGLLPGEPAPRQTTFARFGARLVGNSSISLSYVKVDQRRIDDTSFLNANYSLGLAQNLFFNAFVSHDLEHSDTFLGLTVSFALGDQTSASFSHSRDDETHSNQVNIQRNLPRGTGFGYRLFAEDAHGTPDRRLAEVSASTEVGIYRAEAARFGNDMGYRLSASGGGAVLGGNMFLSRKVDDSFGVVEVGDYENVRIYHENQVIARTNENGAAFIPDMRPFDENQIRFEQADLPLDVRIGDIDTIGVPGFRRGVLVEFDVQASNGALITLVQENGEPLPAGATVNIIGSDQRFPIARRGEAWVTGLERENRLEARWSGQRCTFEITLPEDPGPLPQVGPIVCRGETP